MKEPLDYEPPHELDLRISFGDVLRIAIKLAVGIVVVGAILLGLWVGVMWWLGLWGPHVGFS